MQFSGIAILLTLVSFILKGTERAEGLVLQLDLPEGRFILKGIESMLNFTLFSFIDFTTVSSSKELKVDSPWHPVQGI